MPAINEPHFTSTVKGTNDLGPQRIHQESVQEQRFDSASSTDCSSSASKSPSSAMSVAHTLPPHSFSPSASQLGPEVGLEPSLAAPLVYSEKTIYPGVYALVLARPQEHNALSKRLLADMEDVLDHLATSTSEPLRALIIRSSTAGRFCAGADLKERRTMSEDDVVRFLSGLRRIFDKVAHFPCPTIAALDGPTLGGGLEMAIACDFRVANRNIRKIGFPEAGLGIIPGAGGTQRAPRLLGLTKAKELIYTGRSLTAHEAFQWGLVDYLSNEPSSEGKRAAEADVGSADNEAYVRALELASLMCQSAPLALRAAKLSISKGLDMELDDALQWEIKCYEKLLPTSDRREALDAFKEKRKPVFKGM